MATISMNFSMTIVTCFSISLKGFMRTFKRCMRTARIGNEYLRSFLVLMRLSLKSLLRIIKTLFSLSLLSELWIA